VNTWLHLGGMEEDDAMDPFGSQLDHAILKEDDAMDPFGSEAVPSDDVQVPLRVSAPLWTAAALVCLRPFSCCLLDLGSCAALCVLWQVGRWLTAPCVLLVVQVPGGMSLMSGNAQKAKRQQVAKACLVCKRAKAKCSAARPCSRCVRLRVAGLCMDIDARSKQTVSVSELTVERPLPYKMGVGQFDPGVGRRKTLDRLLAENALHWLRMGDGPLCRMVEVGWDARDIVNLFVSMPDDWRALLMTTCQSLQIIMGRKRQEADKLKLAVADQVMVKCASRELLSESAVLLL